MKKWIKKVLEYNEVKLALIFLAIVVLFSLINPDVFTVANLYALVRASATNAIYALAIMIVMCSGAFDASFAVIGSFGAYVTMYILTQNGLDPHPAIVFLISILICMALEFLNWFMVSILHLQAYIATTGTASLLKGAVLVFVSTSYIYTLPSQIGALGKTYLATAVYGSGIESQLHVSVIFIAVMYLVMHILMTYTNFGRQVYAVGADEEAAERAGINVKRIRLIVFLIAGVICGVAGILRDAVGRFSLPNPAEVVGKENISIAAVILGTGNSSKARGSALGTLLGVLLMSFISNNLILIGIPSFYVELATGVLMYIGLVGQMSNRPRRHSAKEGK
ncbi:MAG: ABC transporter permease [Oscillospiraceae bacterium]|nr:ABC transporter permease [Oscillospiraceae bacterium]